jgi:uncharacterized surface protein with fasciclin (FAS1) repeats
MAMKKMFVVVFMLLKGTLLFAQQTNTYSSGEIRMTSSNNMMDNLNRSRDFTVLVSMIEGAGLSETFRGSGPITLFAPNNRAFEKLPAGTVDTLLKSDHQSDLVHLILSHAVAGGLTIKEITAQIRANNGQATFTTMAGTKLVARINASRNIVLTDENGGESIISKFNVPQSNGVLQIINSVLTPKPKGL